jgi:hypothetical protein
VVCFGVRNCHFGGKSFWYNDLRIEWVLGPDSLRSFSCRIVSSALQLFPK